jgi:putative DNA primase/helicase
MYDIPTIALVGVTMGLTPRSKGEPDLVPGLKRLAEAGFNFIIAFDSDTKPKTVKSVRRAEKRLAERLRAYGCDVLSVTGHWEPGENGEL